MSKKIYIGNLTWDSTADDLLALFQPFGEIVRTQVITDRDTGRSRGFGFVEMRHDADAQRAIETLNATDYRGRALTVNEARARASRAHGEESARS